MPTDEGELRCWTDGNEKQIFWGTGNGYLVAVDAKIGRPIQSFGLNGKVDLMEGLPWTTRGEVTISTRSPTPSSRRRSWSATS